MPWLPYFSLDNAAHVGQPARVPDPLALGDALYVRASWSGRVMASAFGLAPVAVITGVALLWVVELPLPTRSTLGVATIVFGGWVGLRSWRHLGIRVTAQSLRLDRVFSSSEVMWADVIALRMLWENGRLGTGYFVVVVPASRRRVSVGWVPPLEVAGTELLRQFMSDHVPGVHVDPVEPWQDRFGEWHGELHEFDPAESIRSVRRAAVGRWVISIRVTGDGFQAVTSEATGRVVRESPVFADLPAATEAAIEQVRLARSDA
ncbi:MAG: hypothetical protein Q8M22_15910 [Actinomycetota bacterium]|nr:hypothetical protein [Actinomycetota bacterium]